jgi:hypothetical protein
MRFSEYFKAQNSPLYQQLLGLRSQMAQAAQAIYDQWDQGDEGDMQSGFGGICDEIAQAISGVIVESLAGVDVTEGGQDGDDHAYTIAYNDTEAFAVDIPPQVYERGGGYSWQKIEDVRFDANDILIEPVDRQWIEPGY